MILLLGGGAFGNSAAVAVMYFDVPLFRGKHALRRFSGERCATVSALDGNALVCCFGDCVNGINKSIAVPHWHGECVSDCERMRRGCFLLCRDNFADSGELEADDRADRRAPVSVMAMPLKYRSVPLFRASVLQSHTAAKSLDDV